MPSDRLKETVGTVFREIADALSTGHFGQCPRIGVTTVGSEHGPAEIIRGAEMAQQLYPDLEVVLMGPAVQSGLAQISDDYCQRDLPGAMEQALEAGTIDAAVTMHYNFPIGVATVGRVLTPGRGRELYLATTTGTAATDRVTAMVYNALSGIIAAKTCGKANPTVGILNVEGARQVERMLEELRAGGYPFEFAGSLRADGGAVMRGNDLLAGVPDVMVTDTLTGNVLMKVFSAFTTGGDYESSGYGYGPGIGENYEPIICILSRASGAPVVAGAVRYAGDLVRGKLGQVRENEFRAARAAGLDAILAKAAKTTAAAPAEVASPPAKTVTEEIPGVDILEIDNAIQALWRRDVFASPGMGCTGPVIMVAHEDRETAKGILVEAGFLA